MRHTGPSWATRPYSSSRVARQVPLGPINVAPNGNVPMIDHSKCYYYNLLAIVFVSSLSCTAVNVQSQIDCSAWIRRLRQLQIIPTVSSIAWATAVNYDEVYSPLRQYGQYSDIQTSKQTDRQIQIQ